MVRYHDGPPGHMLLHHAQPFYGSFVIEVAIYGYKEFLRHVTIVARNVAVRKPDSTRGNEFRVVDTVHLLHRVIVCPGLILFSLFLFLFYRFSVQILNAIRVLNLLTSLYHESAAACA